MYSYEHSDDRLSILHMNSLLQHAQLELLSAHRATHQLRIYYSVDDLARLGGRDVLRKSAEAASAMNDLYSAIENKIPQTAQNPALQLTTDQIAQAIQCVSSYLRGQREHYFPDAMPLSNQHKARMWPYFSCTLLDQVRIVELRGQRVPTPAFYAQARAVGFDNLPEVTHMDCLTFLDVVVFNETLTERSLFHALVQAVQFQILGPDRYTELFAQSFLRTKSHFTVPLQTHAFTLASKFMCSSPEKFSVEDHVLRWVVDGRY
jgi:hypothetical protein